MMAKQLPVAPHFVATGSDVACVLATHATREKEGSGEDPVKDEYEFLGEMRKVGFMCSRRWIQPLSVPAEEWLPTQINICFLVFLLCKDQIVGL